MDVKAVTFQIWSGRPFSGSPRAIGLTAFEIADEDQRYKFTRHLLRLHRQETLEYTDHYELIRGGDRRAVCYFFILEKPHGRLVYLVKSENANTGSIGQTGARVAFWRDLNFAAPIGITDHVLFDYLLPEWSIIMSDAQSTEHERDFWRTRMAVAVSRGYRVGFANISENTLMWRSADEPYRQWVENHMRAWSVELAAQNLRFLISSP
jgi:hypothetical protein